MLPEDILDPSLPPPPSPVVPGFAVLAGLTLAAKPAPFNRLIAPLLP